jgi:hypothetical protein
MMPLREQLYWLGRPVTLILESESGGLSYIALALVTLCAWLWTGLQAHALDGAAPWRHLTTMPLAAGMALRVDLALLAVADLPLLMPFAAAMFSLHDDPAAVATVAALALQLPLAQALLLRGSRRAAYCLLFDIVGMVLTDAGASRWWVAAIAAAGAAATLSLLIWAPGPQLKRRWAVPRVLRLRAGGSRVLNLAAIALRHLFRISQLAQHMRLLLCMVWPLLLNRLLTLGGLDDGSSRVVLMLLAWPPLIFNLAGLAVDLSMLHAPMLPLYRSLGVARHQLGLATLLVLGALLSVACLPLALVLYQHSHSALVLLILPAGVLTLGVCAQLNVSAGRQAFLPKVIVVGLACAAQVFLLSR